MDKLVITTKQEEVIEAMHSVYKSSERALGDFVLQRQEHALKDFTVEQVSLLLCGWYVLREPFEIGEWVHSKKGGIGELVGFGVGGTKPRHVKVWRDENRALVNIVVSEDKLRKAKPDEIAQEVERRKWATIGRKENHYIVGDIVRHEFRHGFMEVSHISPDDKKLYVWEARNNTDSEVSKELLTLVTPYGQRMDFKEES